MLHMPLAFGMGNLFGVDGFVILVLGLLFFGRKLPEVGKNLGKTIVEFKKGLNGVDDKDSYGETQEEEERPAPPKRIAGGSAPRNRLSATSPSRKRLPESEEV